MHDVACADEKMSAFASVHVGSANKTFVQWSVVALEQSQTFEDLFRSVQSGRFTIIKPSTELSATVLQSVSVEKDKASLSLVQKELSAVDVCISE